MNSPPRKDLGERTAQFAQSTRRWARLLPKNVILHSDIDQVIRSTGSVAANYIEANEAVSKKDCANRLKICRKEAKESRLWFSLIETHTDSSELYRKKLLQEADELTRIFHTIIQKYYS